MHAKVFTVVFGGAPGALGALLCLGCACMLFNTSNDQPLSMRCIVPLDDTVSVFPQLRYVFSAPLADSSVLFSFVPPTSSRYGALLNATRDTVTLQLIDALDGNTKYVLRLAQPVVAVNGSRCLPSDDSTVLYTHALEQEPNDAAVTADSCYSVIFGVISGVDDVDVFWYGAPNPKAIGLQSIDCQDSLYAVDGAGSAFSLSGQVKQTDTLPLPSNAKSPIYVYVRSCTKGSAGKYRLSCMGR